MSSFPYFRSGDLFICEWRRIVISSNRRVGLVTGVACPGRSERVAILSRETGIPLFSRSNQIVISLIDTDIEKERLKVDDFVYPMFLTRSSIVTLCLVECVSMTPITTTLCRRTVLVGQTGCDAPRRVVSST